MAEYPKDLTDAQREILGREMRPHRIDEWVTSLFDGTLAENMPSDPEDTDGIAAAGVAASAAVEEAIAIIESRQPPLPYDELRRRAYPDIGDQLDDLFKQGAFSGDMAAVLQAVKDAHPKG